MTTTVQQFKVGDRVRHIVANFNAVIVGQPFTRGELVWVPVVRDGGFHPDVYSSDALKPIPPAPQWPKKPVTLYLWRNGNVSTMYDVDDQDDEPVATRTIDLTALTVEELLEEGYQFYRSSSNRFRCLTPDDHRDDLDQASRAIAAARAHFLARKGKG